MSTTTSARRRTALGAALSAAVLGLVVPAPSAEAAPPGNPLQRCSTPAPSFDRTDYAVDGEAVSATTGDFNKDGHPDVAAVTSGLGGYYAVILRGDGQGGLGGKSSHDVGQDPVDVAAADLSGDGYDDLAVSHNSLGVPSFEVGKNNTAGGFDFASYNGDHTGGLVPGDFDDDGKLDIAASAGSGLEVWPGQGDGSFGAARGYPTGTPGQGVAAGDFNGDGRLDAVTANRDADTVSVLLQTATGFAPAISLPVHDAPYAVTVGDFDNDGNPDIAVANNYAGPGGEARVVDILLGDGDGGFVATAPVAVGDSQDIVSGDFNHDGDVDLAVLREYSNLVAVITGNGNGGFASPVNFALGGDPRSISAADIDEDGLTDLVSANWYDTTVSVLLNTSRPTNVDPDAGTDSYTAPANGVLSVPAPGVLANDSDDDCDPLTASGAAGPGHGVVDLDPDGSFTYTPTSGYLGADSFTYRAHDGLGGKSEPTTVTLNVSTVDAVDDTATAVEGAAPLAIDVLGNDSDTSGGALTITAVTQPAYGSVVITGTGSGLSYTPPDGFVGPDPFTYTVTSAAGRTDTATVTVTVGSARGCATADFAAPRQASQLVVPSYLVGRGDFNGDGSVDVASFRWDPEDLQIAYNDGSGDFPNAPLVTSSPYNPEVGSFGDLNSDGRLDVVRLSGSNRRMIVTYGAAGGLTGATTSLGVLDDHEATLAAIGDVDEDGAVDVVTSDGYRGLSTKGSVAVIKGDGLGGFTPQPEFDVPGLVQLSLADIDGDGHLDLVGSHLEVDRVWVMLGDGDAGFGPPTWSDVGPRPVQHVTADFDGDGNLDVATVNRLSSDLSVLYGDGTGGFAPAIQLPAGPTVGVGSNLAAADVNADGRPDLVTVQAQPGKVNVFLSRGAGGFAPRQLFGTGSGLVTGATTGDFNGDGSVDVAVGYEDGALRVLDNQCATRVRPTAAADTYVTAEDTELDVHTPGLLGNDTFGGSVTVSVSPGNGPSHGQVEVDPKGSFTYTPEADFNGRDSFTYKVDDGDGGTSTATVNLTVRPSQDGPDAVDDVASVPQDADATTVDVLANDTDVDGDELTVTAITQGGHGTVAITNAGADVSYKPAAGYFGTDSFTYTTSDGHGGTDTATVDITIPRTNTAPVAGDNAATVARDSGANTIDVLTNDTDADNDSLTVATVTQGAHGTVAITHAGVDVSYSPAAGYYGTDTFTYTVSDGFGGTDSATVDVTIPRGNAAPVANDDTATLQQDSGAHTVAVLANDTDADDDSLSVAGITQGAHGTVAITHTGADVSYTPAAGFHGTDTFTYTVHDGHGGTDTAAVNITVTQTPPPARRKLTVLSYDVGRSTARPGHRWVQRRHAVADLIARSGAQVIGLQGTPRRERVGRRTVHPIADLRARLPEFGVVRGDPRLRVPNVLLYRTSEFRALSSGTARLSAGVHRTRRCAQVTPASTTWALLKNVHTGQKYFVVDANLSHGGGCARQRNAETGKLRTLIRKANATNAPVVLLGSLNADHDDRAPRLLDRDLDPTVPLRAATPTYNTGWDVRRTNDSRRLDYVFHSSQLTVTGTRVMGRIYRLGGVRTSPSSHYAVRATFSNP
jgi:endonuclease/exonuclease/phosphatase family metal-dependent hydrolase